MPTVVRAPGRDDTARRSFAGRVGALQRARGIRPDALRQLEKLAPWMRRYAQNIAVFPFTLPIRERVKLAAQEAKAPVSQSALRALERRPDFQTALTFYKAGGFDAAKQRIEEIVPDAIELWAKTVQNLHRSFDRTPATPPPVEAVMRAAEPALDRAFPKRAEQSVVPRITITLTTAQAAALASEPLDVAYELLPPASSTRADSPPVP